MVTERYLAQISDRDHTPTGHPGHMRYVARPFPLAEAVRRYHQNQNSSEFSRSGLMAESRENVGNDSRQMHCQDHAAQFMRTSNALWHHPRLSVLCALLTPDTDWMFANT